MKNSKSIQPQLSAAAFREAGLRLLEEWPRFVKEEASLVDSAARTRFVVDGQGCMRRPCDLYDSSDRELLALLGEDSFPSPDFSSPAALISLRTLGLRTIMSTSGVISSARSVEFLLQQAQATLGERQPQLVGENIDIRIELALQRGVKLARYLDMHTDMLVADIKLAAGFDAASEEAHVIAIKDAKKLLLDGRAAALEAALAALPPGDDTSETALTSSARANEKFELAAIDASLTPAWKIIWATFKAELSAIAWLPVQQNKCPSLAATSAGGGPLMTLLPWPKGGWPVCVSPQRTRPCEDIWACSFTFAVPVHAAVSPAFRQLLGFDTPLRPGAVASQFLLISKAYNGAVGTAAPGIDIHSGGSYDKSSEELKSLRSTLSGVLPRLYVALSGFVGIGTEIATVAKALGDKPWLWVGDAFVGTTQVAFEAPSDARPYLHRLPSELRIFEPLFRALGVRESFSPSDFAHTLSALALKYGGRAGGNVSGGECVLNDKDLGLAISMYRVFDLLVQINTSLFNKRTSIHSRPNFI